LGPAIAGLGYEGVEIGHNILDLPSLKLEPWHNLMDAIGQWSLQIGNRILESQSAERRRGCERTLADLIASGGGSGTVA
jgi:hypothetical protein